MSVSAIPYVTLKHLLKTGVSLGMRRYWRTFLPLIGILLFSVVSWRDFRVNREIHEHLPNKYFMWSAIRLDTDPANQRKWEFGTCREGEKNCVTWDLKDTWVDPGVLDGFLLLTAFPAFILGRLTAGMLGTMGINQLTTFMLSTPVLLLLWYYFVGRLLDGWMHRRSNRRASTPD